MNSRACIPSLLFLPSRSLLHVSQKIIRRRRALGFGYRAKYIVAAVQFLRAQEGGGATWMATWRAPATSLAATVEGLTAVPGVGPKVAGCIALFSLDKHDSIPVDVHVWNLATRCVHKGSFGPFFSFSPILFFSTTRNVQ